ncbi:hypothetical protein FACS1894184_20280 [Clostridia bacterium]|nr:hypothetical protein FACS1894184_20280 [Clostridia bacterium]
MTYYQIKFIDALDTYELEGMVNKFLATIDWGDLTEITYDWGNTIQRAIIRYVQRDGVGRGTHGAGEQIAVEVSR